MNKNQAVHRMRYSTPMRLLHWVMAAGFIFMWTSGYAMKSLVEDDGPMEELIFGLHISFGVTLAGLLIARIYMRITTVLPSPPSGLTCWEIKASHIGHIALYVFPLLIITVGWAETDFGGHGVTWFDIEMPKLFPTMESLWGIELEDATSEIHEILAYTMLAVVVIHVAAVIKHRWFDQRDVLYRMTFGKSDVET